MRKIFIGAGLLLIFLLVALRLSDPAGMQALRLAYFDQMQVWHPREVQDFPVRVVDIDEASLDAYGQWPWPRTRLAELVDRLSDSGAAVIVFDMLFVEPDRMSPHRLLVQPPYRDLLGDRRLADLPDYDADFARAMAGRAVILGMANTIQTDAAPPEQKSGIVEIGNAPRQGLIMTAGVTPPLPILSQTAQGLGNISMSPHDTSERVRRVPLLWTTPSGQVIPSLALETLRVAFGESSYILRGADDAPGAIQSVRVGPLTIPTTSDGSIWVRYRPDHPALYVSATRVFSSPPETLRQEFEGRIVMIGTSAAGLLDLRTTALSETVPGVSIHAQIVEQILQGAFIHRTDFIAAIEVLSLIVLGSVILWIMSVSGALVSVFAAALGASGIILSSWVLFTSYGTFLDITFPVLGGGLFFAIMTAFQFFVADREKKMLRRSFSHYVAPEILQQIEQSGHRLKLGGELKSVSVMFCDIRNFTALSETMAATQTVSILNDVFGALSSEIFKQRGTIDKYIGDSVMAFWNAPVDVEDYPLRTCLAALGMRRAIAKLNPKLDPRPAKDIGIAIGIGMGTACIGNVGSKERFDYSAIGDVVNRAARIEASCREVSHDILVSEDVRQAASGLAFLEAGFLSLKGVSQRQKIYALIGDDALCQTAAFQQLSALHETVLAALAQGDDAPAEMIAACMNLARSIDADLADFYGRLAPRASDFRL